MNYKLEELELCLYKDYLIFLVISVRTVVVFVKYFYVTILRNAFVLNLP